MNLRKLQMVELDILKTVVEICEKHDLKYYLIGGTLLGAVRHKGFIPWDDDVDIGMPRADYEKFLKIFSSLQSDSISLMHYKYNPNAYTYYAKAVNNTTKVKEINADKSSGVWVDIFPLDAIPSNIFLRTAYSISLQLWKYVFRIFNLDVNKKRPWHKQIIVNSLKLLFGNFTLKQIFDNIDRILVNGNRKKSQNVGNLMGAYGFREIVPNTYLGNGSVVEFEGLMLKAPQYYDDFLTHMYGDYMTLPPENKRGGHTLEIIYL